MAANLNQQFPMMLYRAVEDSFGGEGAKEELLVNSKKELDAALREGWGSSRGGVPEIDVVNGMIADKQKEMDVLIARRDMILGLSKSAGTVDEEADLDEIDTAPIATPIPAARPQGRRPGTVPPPKSGGHLPRLGPNQAREVEAP